MVEPLRREFNARWTESGYARFLSDLAEACDGPIPFRLSETPCFFHRELLDRLAQAGADLIDQLSTPAYREIARRSIPAEHNAPNEPDHPMFIQADFGLLREPDGQIGARLVEIQGFPSVYAFQPKISQAYIDAYGLDPRLQYLAPGLGIEAYHRLLRTAIVGGHDPAEVVLLEIDPDHQKTRCDFVLTERICGVRAVCLTKVEKRGNRLFHDGRPIRRIYNRAIIDEVERRGVRPPFDFRDDLDVEWAGHPNFYFRISKFSLPHLNHPTVPRTVFLSSLDHAPDDLENWVLKPLYSFAGLGVKIGPTRADLDSISDRDNYILQERVHFTPVIETPEGGAKVEVRVMYVWPDDGPLAAVCNIVRTGRGNMMGVDHNKDMRWVGGSAALYEP
jgi:hypothetical protein